MCNIIIFLASEERCANLPSTNGSILYVPPDNIFHNLPAGKHYVGTIATYICSLWYQLVGGSVKTCISGGMWNGTVICGKLITKCNYYSCILASVSIGSIFVPFEHDIEWTRKYLDEHCHILL